MKLFYLLAIVFIILVIFFGVGRLLNITGRGVEPSRGEVFGLSVSPTKPLFGEQAEISIAVKNTEKIKNDYKLAYIVTKDGLVKTISDIDFSLPPNGTIALTPTLIPDDLGEHILLVELYDKLGIELFDRITKNFEVVSEIGPFDLRLELPTSVVSPGENIPALLTIGNLGEKGSEVNIDLKVKCYNQSDIQNRFYIFLEPKKIIENIVNIASCEETGLHEISANIVHLNRTWIAAVNQLYLQESFLNISATIPETIEVTAGEPERANIIVTNIGKDTINNMRLLVEKVPSKWVKVEPPVIPQAEPGGTVLFVVTFSTPDDLEPQMLPVRITIAAEEALVRREIQLKIIQSPFTTAPTNLTETITPPEIKPSEEKETKPLIAVSVIVSGILVTAGVLIFKFRRAFLTVRKPAKIPIKKPSEIRKEENALKGLEKAYEEGVITKQTYLRTKKLITKKKVAKLWLKKRKEL